MMQRLATAIREQINPLIDLYDARLRTIPGYAHMPDAARRNVEQSVLEMVAHCLDIGADRELVQYVQQRAEQVKAQGLDLEWFQRAVAVPEEILVPLLETVEESNFLWRAMQHAQNAVWHLIAAGRRQIEESLRASEERYQTIFNSTPVMFWLKDTHNRTLRINRAAAAFEGVRPEDVEGKAASELYPPEQANAYYQDDLAVIQSGRPKVGIIEQHSRIGTGEPMWVETGKVPVRNDKGEITGVLAFAVDITDRKQAEQQAQRSLERRARQVQTTTQVAQEIALAHDLNELFNRVVTLIKERFDYYHTQIFRYEAKLGAVVLVAGYGEAGQAMLAAGHRLPMGHGVVGAAAAKGRSILASDVSSDPDWRPNPHLPETRGELAVPIAFRNEVLGILDVQSDQRGALTDDDRLLLEGLCGQIAIAMESRRVEAALREREEDLNAMLEYSPEAIGMVNTRTGLFESVNQAAERLYGLNREDLVKVGPAQMSPEFQPDGRPSRDAALEKLGAALKGETPVFEWVHLNAAGQPIQCEVRLVGLTSMRSHLVRFSVTDITERKLAELESERARQQMEEAMHEAQRLYAAVSHEGWQDYRQFGRLPHGYRFDRALIEPAGHLWLPELGEAVTSHALVTSETGDRPVAVTPLTVRGEIVGALGVVDDSHRPLGSDELTLIESVAEQVALALESARLFDQTQRDAERERTLNRITGRIRSAQSVEQVLEFAAEELSAVTRASRSVVEIRPGPHAPGPAGQGNGNKDVL